MNGSMAMAFASSVCACSDVSDVSDNSSSVVASAAVRLRVERPGVVPYVTVGVPLDAAMSCSGLRGDVPGFLGMTKSSSLVACLYSSGERTSARCPSSVCKDEIHNAFLLIASWKARKLLYVGLLLGLEMCGISLGAMVKRETMPSSSA